MEYQERGGDGGLGGGGGGRGGGGLGEDSELGGGGLGEDGDGGSGGLGGGLGGVGGSGGEKGFSDKGGDWGASAFPQLHPSREGARTKLWCNPHARVASYPVVALSHPLARALTCNL